MKSFILYYAVLGMIGWFATQLQQLDYQSVSGVESSTELRNPLIRPASALFTIMR